MHRRYLPLLILPVAALALGFAAFGGRAQVQAQQQTEPVELFAGCNNVTLTWASGTSVSTVAEDVSPASALQAIWRFNNAEQTFVGFSPQFPQASDYKSANLLDAVYICMSAPGTLTRPALAMPSGG